MGQWLAWGLFLVASVGLGFLLGTGLWPALRMRIYGPVGLRVLSPCWRPCPFCGGQPFMRQMREEERGADLYHFTCRRCDARGGWRLSEDEALRGWNMRVRG